jgi:cellulose synthase/poly-beta-1,6-N-acetylglucosamine synthase-like glycosyltransferase
VLTLSIEFAVAYLAIVATLAIVAALGAGGRRDDAGDDREALAASRFTIPVSIIVPAPEGVNTIGRAVSDLLGLNYPELEVIVVADGVLGAAPGEFASDWQLEAREFFYRKTIETAEVRRIYRSGRDARLMVIDKAADGYADALNCGINVARYRYVMSVSPDVTFDRDALLRLMKSALRDPAAVVGAANHVERGADPDDRNQPAGLFALFQRLASARSLMDSRLAWRNLGGGLGPAGAVMIWRRDAVIKLTGFSTTAADPDLDMMGRLQMRGIDGGGRVDRRADVFGRVAPQSFRDVLGAAARRQRSAIELLFASVRGGTGTLDARTLAYFVETEIATPLAQVWVVVATLAGALLGWFSWTSVILAIILLALGNAAVSAAALLLRGSAPGAPELPELKSLLAVGPLEFILQTPALAAARIAAAIAFVIPSR